MSHLKRTNSKIAVLASVVLLPITISIVVPVCSFSVLHINARTHRRTCFKSRVWVKQQDFKQQLGQFERLPELGKETRQIKVLNFLSRGPLSYNKIWDLQKELQDRHLHGNETDVVLFLEHKPVYTLGTASNFSYILNNTNKDIIRTERGGEVTYHGPGQLVVYPILNLRNYKQDIHWYMRALEEVILQALRNIGIDEATRKEGLTGVWVNGAKIAALGVKVRRWITMHGMAINVNAESLDAFEGIIPCGIMDCRTCCVNNFAQKPISIEEFASQIEKSMADIFLVKVNRINDMNDAV